MSSIADDTRWMDATEVGKLITDGEVTAAEMTQAAIERVEAHDGPLNSVTVKWFDEARSVSESELPVGPFRGVPFLLKDLWIHYAGQTMTNGNVAFKNDEPVSQVDSVLTSRFKGAGLVTLGRSASPEMGTLPVTETAAHGATRNPWDTDRVPGGSSGGAAAAVAAGIVPLAHASDGGGSIRIPASCCGLVGLKPSQGRITMQGHGVESSLSVDFAVTRSVRDSAVLLDAVHGPGVGDTVIAPAPTRRYVQELGVDPGSLRIGLLDYHPHGGNLHGDCVDATRSAALLLEGLGHHVEDSHPESMDDTEFVAQFMALWAGTRASGLANMERQLGRTITEDELEPHNWVQAQHANAMTAAQYANSLGAVASFRRETQQWWAEGWDLLLTPTLAEPPLLIGECDSTKENPMAGMARAGEFVPFTPAFNTTGQPAISLPTYWNAAGLPIGIQLVAAYGREDLLFQVASQIEAAAPWAHRRPPQT